jgi:uncharacterized membrane protein YcaP (DUF421 family)
MSELFDWTLGSWRTVGFVALSTLLIYLSVVVALRIGERRTLAEMSSFDFAVAVAVGSIIGRVSTTRSPTYVQGLAALVTLLLAHHLITFARARPARLKTWVERPPRVLLRDGRVLGTALRREHLTEEDLMRKLREHDVHDLAEVELVVLEATGGFSVLRRATYPVDDLICRGLGAGAHSASDGTREPKKPQVLKGGRHGIVRGDEGQGQGGGWRSHREPQSGA